MDAGAQSAERRCLEADIPAVAARHVARDRQAEADAAGCLIARRIEPDERAKHALACATAAEVRAG